MIGLRCMMTSSSVSINVRNSRVYGESVIITGKHTLPTDGVMPVLLRLEALLESIVHKMGDHLYGVPQTPRRIAIDISGSRNSSGFPLFITADRALASQWHQRRETVLQMLHHLEEGVPATQRMKSMLLRASKYVWRKTSAYIDLD